MLLCGDRVLTKGIGKPQVVADLYYSMLLVCIYLDSGIFFLYFSYFPHMFDSVPCLFNIYSS